MNKMQKGFSLVELLVSMGIFLVIIEGVMGVLVYGIRLQRRLLIEQEVAGELSYALEYMSRALRMAIRDDDGNLGCLPANYSYDNTEGDPTVVRFVNHLQGDDCQEFFLEDNILKYKIDVGGANEVFGLTPLPPRVAIQNVEFWLLGEQKGDNLQARVTIAISATSSGLSLPINLQTTVSQRQLDAD